LWCVWSSFCSERRRAAWKRFETLQVDQDVAKQFLSVNQTSEVIMHYQSFWSKSS
jgi:hypothetical protein